MFQSIAAMVMFVKDMDTCKTFYRDTLGLEVTEDDPEHVVVHVDNVYFLLLEVGAAAHMISEQELELKIEGGPRGLLAVGVEDVDAAYKALKAKGVTFLRPQPISSGGCARHTLPILKATSGRSTSPLAPKPEGLQELEGVNFQISPFGLLTFASLMAPSV